MRLLAFKGAEVRVVVVGAGADSRCSGVGSCSGVATLCLEGEEARSGFLCFFDAGDEERPLSLDKLLWCSLLVGFFALAFKRCWNCANSTALRILRFMTISGQARRR